LGQKATAEYRSVSGCSTLPTEQDGGSGTVCSHFDEQCLQRELMTGAVNTGVQNFLSRITIASLEDLGYSVSYSTADAFRASNLGPGCSCRRRGLGETSSSARDDDTWQRINTTSTSSSSSPSRRRRLSDEMYQYAQEQGQWYLNSQPSLPVAVMADLNDKGVRYVGDQYVSVIVRDEDGGIFDVEVYKEKE
jgi:Leishmanolysin